MLARAYFIFHSYRIGYFIFFLNLIGNSRFQSPCRSSGRLEVADGKEVRRACAGSETGLSVAFQGTTGS